MACGDHVLRKTSSRYVIFDPDYLSTISDGIKRVVADSATRYAALLHPNYNREIGASMTTADAQNPANSMS